MAQFEDVNSMIDETQIMMESYRDRLPEQLAKIRSDKNPRPLVDNVKVDAYGAPTALGDVATISVPEPTTIVVRPFDPSQLSAVHGALAKIAPAQTDGQTIRVSVPPLSQDDRKSLVSEAAQSAESAVLGIESIHRGSQGWLDKQALAAETYEAVKRKLEQLRDRVTKEVGDALAKKKGEFDAA